ncbi:hypothetical protein [Streptomyces sp. NBC_00557]|jgi:hypothetical protein|uniref:hypothetical protein n=1 Tax=Streptomyces sp. NBC_00557 TaxID=2975776 RepID=UPI002E817C51|nr:hypothetical protein [Streptomyces sp. NBC_00557]WUC33866.1 hypothetical protein OG956_06415 [Streptomyces sp. NBC_00557]
MLAETLTALAAAGGAAVVQAAGTDAWSGFRQGMARLIGQGDPERERDAARQLERTAALLAAEQGDDQARMLRQVEQNGVWRGRLESLLETLDDARRRQAAADLRALLQTHAEPAGGASAPGGVAANRDVTIRAEAPNGVATGLNYGGFVFSVPQLPDPHQG